MCVKAYQPARKFYDLCNRQFLPAVIKESDRQKASELVRGELRQEYEAHRTEIDKVVTMTEQRIKRDEEMAEAAIRSWSFLLNCLTAALIGLTLGISWFIGQGIVRPTTVLIDRVRDMAEGAGDLTARVNITSKDEIGQLALWINTVIQKIHDLVVRVRGANFQLLSTASQIASTLKEQESTMQNFGASTTEIAAAVKEIAATSQELVGTMNDVNEGANQTALLASAGRAGLVTMETTMHQLAASTGSISTKLSVIREKADDINVVVTTITKVADQTNLLSINAAIEAEKAGEYGRGFLVVAREIRRLADQTAVATLDIEHMVRHMQAAVSAGVMEMDKFSEEVRSGMGRVSDINSQMSQIIEQVHTLSQRFEAVNEGMRQQSLGAKQIDDAMAQLAAGASQIATSLREFTGATTNLRESVDGLKQEISRFTVSA